MPWVSPPWALTADPAPYRPLLSASGDLDTQVARGLCAAPGSPGPAHPVPGVGTQEALGEIRGTHGPCGTRWGPRVQVGITWVSCVGHAGVTYSRGITGCHMGVTWIIGSHGIRWGWVKGVTWVSGGVVWKHLGGHPAATPASALGGRGGAQPELGELVHLVVTWPLHLGCRSSAPSSERSPRTSSLVRDTETPCSGVQESSAVNGPWGHLAGSRTHTGLVAAPALLC